MTEPGADATVLERELVRAGRESRLPSREKRQIWTGISALSISQPVTGGNSTPGSNPGGGAAAGTGASGGSALMLTAVKATLLAGMLAVGSVAGYRAWQHRPPPVAPRVEPAIAAMPMPMPMPMPPPMPMPMPAERTATPALEAATAVSRLPAPSSAAPSSAAPSSSASSSSAPFGKKVQPSRLEAEGRTVLEARARIREGRFEDALRLLDSAEIQFADGALAQEREALAIEALSRAGQRATAATRAAAFLRAYPGSPHAARVQTLGAP